MTDHRPLRIWLIDDEPDDRQLTRRAIRRFFPRAEVREIDSPEAWHQALETTLPDLVITDYWLHWGDGLQVLQTIKARDPCCPVVMFTDSATEPLMVKAFREGLDDYLLKGPQHVRLIPITLANALERSRHQRATHQAKAQLRLLHEIDRRILRAQTPQEIAASALPLLQPFLGTLFLVVIRTGSAPTAYRLLAAQGIPAETLEGCLPPQEIFHAFLHNTQPRTLPFPPPFLAKDAPCTERLAQSGAQALTLLPLKAAERLLGIMVLGWRSAQDVDNQVIEVAYQVASQLAVALHATNLLEEERHARHIAETLQRVSLNLAQLLNPQEILHTFLDEVALLIPYMSANVWMVTEGHWQMKAHRGYERYGLKPEQLDAFKVALNAWPTFRTIQKTLAPLLIPDTRKDPRWTPAPKTEAIRSWLGVPLVVGHQLLGIFSLDHTEPHAFSDEQVSLAQALAASAALALHNANLYQREAQRRQALEIARQAALHITQASDLEQVFQNLLLRITNLTNSKDAHIFLYDAEKDRLYLGAAYYHGAIQHRALFEPRPTGVTATAARTGHEMLLPDVRQSPFYTPAWGDWKGSIICIPLKIGAQVVGVMNVAWEVPHGYTSATLQILRLLADHAAIAIQHARLVGDLRKRLREMEVMGTLASALRQAPDSAQVAQTLVQQTCQLVEAPYGLLLLIQREPEDETRYRVILDAQQGFSADIVGRFQVVGRDAPLVQYAHQSEPSHLAGEHLPDPLPHLLAHQHHSLSRAACAPLLPNAGESLGLLLVGREPTQPPFTLNEFHLLRTAAEIGANALQRTRAYEELQASFLQTVLALAQAIDAKDAYTGDHSARLAEWALAVAEEMGLSEAQKRYLHWAALLHDIGKIGIPDDVLLKSSPLTPSEWRLMKQHPEIGARIIAQVKGLQPVAQIIAAHHERWDGSGYPKGLRGEEIPLEARILAVVDSYGAMIDERRYRPPRTHEEALEEIRRNAGRLYDPKVVAAFLKVMALGPHQPPIPPPLPPVQPPVA